MDGFTFSTANRIIFGAGSVAELPETAHSHGMRRIMVVAGRSPERIAGLCELLRRKGLELTVFCVAGEPTVDLVRQGTKLAAEGHCDGVVAVGGGSVLDAGKAIASLMRNEGDVFDYLEVIGQGQPVTKPSAPWIAVPTTAGTGAEVTTNAVLFSPEHKVKVSLRSPWMLPAAAIVDPELGVGVPREQTLASGMDALTQLIEAYVSCRANPITDGFCLQGLPLVARSLKRVCAKGEDIPARTDMALASLLGGLALSNAGLGVVHGFAGPLGGMFCVPHGAICAALLARGMAANLACARRTPNCSGTVARYQTVARCLLGRDDAEAEDGVRFVHQLSAELKVKPLRSFGMRPEHADEVVAKAQQASSMKKNPVVLSPEELSDVYLSAL